MLRIVGDLHGDVKKFESLVGSHWHTVQVGDYSIEESDWKEYMDSDHDAFIVPGNHDHWPSIPKALSDRGRNKPWGVNNVDNMAREWQSFFWVSGAESTDKAHRVEGVDIWEDEQLTYSQGFQCIEDWKNSKADIVITHDCPDMLLQELHAETGKPSLTQEILQQMWEVKKPRLWVFGHHHIDKTMLCDRTTFVALGEGSHIDFHW